MSNPTKASGTADESSAEPRYPTDELQPQSAITERDALAEREDGTIRGGSSAEDSPGADPVGAVPIIKLTTDEQQSIDAVAEYQALSEREDGTNIG
jgi:hypothetical protein